MGNSVSAETVHNVGTKVNPPSECPMHNKAENVPKKSSSECPVQHGKEAKAPSECPVQHGNDINPYNMVIKNLVPEILQI